LKTDNSSGPEMKVKELIEMLEKQDQELRVVVDGYEGDFDEVDKIEYVPIKFNKNHKAWMGEFSEVELDDSDEYAVLLPRKS
jgi:hypothetical protein